MHAFTRAPRPDWFDDLSGEVETAFEVVGASTPGWADPEAWIGALRGADDWLRVQRLDPAVAGGLSLVVATTMAYGASFGFDLGIADDARGPVYLDSVPDCGCDACDLGSADLLETLDGWILTVARGGVLHARGDDGQATRTIDGWQSQSRGTHDRTSHVVDVSWLDDSRPVPEEVRRWRGQPWL